MRIKVSSVFHEIKSNPGFRGYALEGGSRCFHPETLIVTNEGSKPISEIKKDDKVLTFNEENNEHEYKKVLDVFKFSNKKKSVRIKLKNGKEIICTEDHKFYFKGGWIEVKQILSLLHENNSKL